MIKNSRKIFFLFLLAFFLLEPFSALAISGKIQETYPKLTNIYLDWAVPERDAAALAKWDVLVLDMDVATNNPETIRKIRRLNPDIIILAYVATEEVNVNADSLYGQLHKELVSWANANWFLTDRSGNQVSFWPGAHNLNITDGCPPGPDGKRWNDVLPKFVKEKIISSGLWDGVFYDNLWPSVSWFNSGNLDIDHNGQVLSAAVMDEKWIKGNIEIIQKTRELLGDQYLIVANGHVFDRYHPYLNGIMLEGFPSPYEADGTWAGSMKSYTLSKNFHSPRVFLVNANTNGKWEENNYRRMRFSLGSVSLGDGYSSFDYGSLDHGQTWWYDEYDVNLGKPIGNPINILDKNNSTWKKGVWRRDFENGIVVVNSTDENKNYVFSDEAFNKINGSQDRLINNGARVNMVSLMGQDAVILLGTPKKSGGVSQSPVEAVIKPVVEKPKSETSIDLIKNSAFQNGLFIRAFNESGDQARGGWFAYSDKYPAGSQIIVSDINADGLDEVVVNNNGTVSIYRNNSILRSFRPYEGKFKGDISIAVADLNGDATKEIITGAGAGGGPHVRVFDQYGKPLIGGFFAYDRNFRGGVNVAVIDLNGDGTQEIVTAPGKGGGPQIRVFTKDGRLLTGGFFAYDRNFRGGVSLAVGNVDGQGAKEIITAPGVGSSPEVRVFSKDGQVIKKFLAYDNNMTSGIKVSVSDVNADGKVEILVGSSDY